MMDFDDNIADPDKWLVNQHFEFITNSYVHRQLELDVRKELVRVHDEMLENHAKLHHNANMKRLAVPQDMRNVKLSDVLKDTGAGDLKTIMQKIIELGEKTATPRSSQTGSSGFRRPPLPPRTINVLSTPNNFVTPENTGVHAFQNKLPTTVKRQPPRYAKPGEMVFAFSATGSPVIPSRGGAMLPPDRATDTTRVKIAEGINKVIDVDLVFRDAPPETKNNFTTDFRCWAKEWTSTHAKKVVAARVAKKKTPASTAKHVRF